MLKAIPGEYAADGIASSLHARDDSNLLKDPERFHLHPIIDDLAARRGARWNIRTCIFLPLVTLTKK
jgi:hypothetical protein